MKDFKCRLWDKKRLNMVVIGDRFPEADGWYMYGNGTIALYDNGDFVKNGFRQHNVRYYPNGEERFDVLLYTGLKDKKEKEMFEADIIKFNFWWFDGNIAESELTGSIIYIEELMSFGLKGVRNKEWLKHIGGRDGDSDTAAFSNWLFDEADFEIIGNIYENPELMLGDGSERV